MGAITNAIPQMTSSYVVRTRRYRWSAGTWQYREDFYREYEVPFTGDAPESRQADIPSGWTYAGWETRVKTLIPRVGVHVDKFFQENLDWTDE